MVEILFIKGVSGFFAGPGTNPRLRHAMEEASWVTIESDPGVFTELIDNLGVKGLQVQELWECSTEALEQHKPVFGIIFLFKYGGEAQSSIVQPNIVHDVPNLFFANQVINNACATQAILSILMNSNCSGINLGHELTQFKNNTKHFPPKAKGVAIANNPLFRQVHNSFHHEDNISVTNKNALNAEDLYHFVSYVPFENHLYELDGLQSGPIDWGQVDNDSWLSKVAPIIQARIAVFQEGEVHFNLMAVIGNKNQAYQEQIEKYNLEKSTLLAQLEELDSMKNSAQHTHPMDQDPTINPTDNTVNEIRSRLEAIKNLLAVLHESKREQDDMFKTWSKENIRRRHDYTPFLYNMLKILADKGQLQPLIDRAKQKAINKGYDQVSK